MTNQTNDKVPWTEQLRPLLDKYLAKKKRIEEGPRVRLREAWVEHWLEKIRDAKANGRDG